MDIFQKFYSAANPELAKAMSAYMRGQFAFLGIQKPERSKLSKEFLANITMQAASKSSSPKRKAEEKQIKPDWDFIFKCWECDEREFQYLALEYLAKIKNFLTPKDIPNLKKIAISKPWWDTIDCLDRIVGDIALRFSDVNKILLKWSVDKNIWLRRIAIDHQLLRKNKTDTAFFEQILRNNLSFPPPAFEASKMDEFFINKAIGWSLREYSKTNPEWVRKFIEKHKSKMSNLSIREGGKYV